MLKLTLRRNDAPSYRTATIEFPAIEGDLQKMLDGIGVGITTEKNCIVDQITGDDGALQQFTDQCVNADEVQYLAKRLDSFDKKEMQTFRAAAFTEQLTEVKDLINLTFNLHCHCLVSDFSDTAAIGQNYEFSRLMTMSMEEMERTNFEEIGRRLVGEKKGAITPYGVLYATGNQPELVYNGRQFPEYSYRGDDVAVITLEVGDPKSGVQYEYLYLPCWDVEIQKACCRLGVESAHSCAASLECTVMDENVYRIFTEDSPLSEHLDALNNLARAYRGFDSQACAAFHAIVDMVSLKTPDDVAVLADNFYEFTAIPGVHNPTAYGRYMIIDSGRYEFDENLEEYIDFKLYGEQRIRAEGGSFTDYGYIAYRGNTPAVMELLDREQTQGMTMGGM